MSLVDDFADIFRFAALHCDIPAHPELGFEERLTSNIVADLLNGTASVIVQSPGEMGDVSGIPLPEEVAA